MLEINQKQQELDSGNDVKLKSLIIAIGRCFRLLARNWLWILAGSIVGGVIFLVFSICRPVEYKAKLFFIVDEDKGGMGLGAASGILSQLGLNIGGLTSSGGFFEGDNIIEFLTSRSMVDKTLLSSGEQNVESDLLVNRFVELGGYRKKWEKNERLEGLVFRDTIGVYLQDSVMARFYKLINKKHLKIAKKNKRLNIIEINFKSSDEVFSKAFVETLIQNASDFYIQTRTLRSKENLEVLTHQVDSVRRELNEAIEGVAAATDANPNPNRALQSLRVGSQLRTVDVQANTEILKELVKNQELARITLRNEKPIIQILDKPILPLENNKIGKALAILIGAVAGGFLVCLALILKRIYRAIMNEPRT